RQSSWMQMSSSRFHSPGLSSSDPASAWLLGDPKAIQGARGFHFGASGLLSGLGSLGPTRMSIADVDCDQYSPSPCSMTWNSCDSCQDFQYSTPKSPRL